LIFEKNIQKDPFRALKISDTSFFDKDSTFITETKNHCKGKNDFNQFNIFAEYIMQGKNAEFTLSIDENHFKEKYSGIMKSTMQNDNRKDMEIRQLFDIKKIAKACNDFYFDKLDNDYRNYFNQISIIDNKIKIADKEKIKNEIHTNKNEFLIRLGRFSQFESITMDELRKDPSYPVSINLVLYNREYYPAGWAKVTWEELKK